MGTYLRPSRLEDALTALARPHMVLAGGTDFYPARVGRAIDEDVLDIGGIAVLRGISADAAGWRLGATTTWSELLETDLPPLFDGLKQAAREGGGRQSGAGRFRTSARSPATCAMPRRRPTACPACWRSMPKSKSRARPAAASCRCDSSSPACAAPP